MLLLADDAARLRLHQVLLRQTTGRVLGRTVPNLRHAARCDLERATLLTLLTLLTILASNVRHSIVRP